MDKSRNIIITLIIIILVLVIALVAAMIYIFTNKNDNDKVRNIVTNNVNVNEVEDNESEEDNELDNNEVDTENNEEGNVIDNAEQDENNAVDNNENPAPEEDPEDMEKLSFNSAFYSYLGNITGEKLYSLLQTIQNSNTSNPERQITLSSNNLQDLNGIVATDIYAITFSYDDNGYIGNINIDKKI